MIENIIIKGYIGKKIYDDSNTYNKGYKVYIFYPNNDCISGVKLNKYGNISIAGIMPNLIESKEYTISCELDINSKFSGSYVLKNISSDRTDNVGTEETVNFLQSINISTNIIENIIKVYPNIVDLICDGKLNMIDVKKVEGLGVKKLKSIVKKVNENYKFFDIMNEYADMKLTMNMIQKLYNSYTSIETLKKAMDENPYVCLCKIARVGFKTADACILAKNESFKSSPYRMKECINYLLKENENNGNTWIYVSELHKQCMEITPECINYFTNVIKENEEIYVELETKRVALRGTYMCERDIAYKVQELINCKKNYNFEVEKYSMSRDGFELSSKQRQILPILNEHSICILSGFAGTGKTTSVKATVDMLTDKNKSILLLAPTGRASQVLSDMTGLQSSTIHRALRIKGTDNETCVKIEEDFVICDESSMIDILLMKNLLQAINPKKTTILFICDPEQLASVGCGNVISDMIKSNKIPVVFLDEVFRYGEGGLSYIATKVRNGHKFLDVLDERNIINFGKNRDYSFLKCPKESTLKTVMMLYKKLLQNNISKNDVIVLSAYNKGELGTYNLNNIIQGYVNPSIGEDKMFRTIDGIKIAFREGDRVIQTVNKYNVPIYDELKENEQGDDLFIEDIQAINKITNVFNGDDGTVVKVCDEFIVVNFNGILVKYEEKDLVTLLLGYAISVHKSQGSTFNNVILITPISHKYFTKRNLLYVGITRARNRVFHIGDIGTVNYTLRQSETVMRHTFLLDLLK